MKNVLKYLLPLAAVLLFASCGLLNPTAGNIQGKADLEVALSLRGYRTLSPLILDKVNIFRVTAENTTLGQTFIEEIPYTSEQASGVGRSGGIQALLLQFLGLPYGSYTLTAEAFGSPEGTQVLFLQGTVSGVVLDENNYREDITINLSPVGTGDGSLSFTVRFPQDSMGQHLVTSWDMKLQGPLPALTQVWPASGVHSGIPDVDRYSLIQVNPLTPGDYLMTMNFYKDSTAYPSPWIETVVILPGMETPGTGRDFIELSSDGFNSKPDQVSYLEVTPKESSGSIYAQLLWVDSSDMELGYNIYRSVNSLPSVLVETASSNVTSWVDMDIASGNSYSYEVAAYTAAGEGSRSSAVSFGYPTGPTFRAEFLLPGDTEGKLLYNGGILNDLGTILGEELVAGVTYPFQVRLSNLGSSGTLNVNSFNFNSGYISGTYGGGALSPGQSVLVDMEITNLTAGTLTEENLTITSDGGTVTWKLGGSVRAPVTYFVYGYNGNDAYSGLDPDFPFATIGKALSLARSGDSIKVGAVGVGAQGYYPENLFITQNVNISGNWNYLFNTQNRANWETTITASTGTALTIEGGASPTLSQLQFSGQSADNYSTVLVTGASNPIFTSLEISSSGTNLGQYLAITVSGGSTLTMTDSTIKQPTTGVFNSSRGLSLIGSTFIGEDNVWDASTVTDGGTATQIEVTGISTLSLLRETFIHSGNANTNDAIKLDNTGVKTLQIEETLFDIAGASSTPVASRALNMQGPPGSQLQFLRNRVQYKGAANNINLMVIGSDVSGLIANNLIQSVNNAAVNKRGIMTFNGVGSNAGTLQIYHNTFYLPGSWSFIELQTPNGDIQNNIFLGNGGGGTAVYDNGSKPAYFRGNALYGIDNALQGVAAATSLEVNKKEITGDAITGQSTRGNAVINPLLNTTPITSGDAPLTFIGPNPWNVPPQIRFGATDLSILVPDDFTGNLRKTSGGHTVGAYDLTYSGTDTAWPYGPLGDWNFAGGGTGNAGVSGINWNLIAGAGSPGTSQTDRFGDYEGNFDGSSDYHTIGFLSGLGELSHGFTVSAFVSMSDLVGDPTGTIIRAHQNDPSRFWELDAEYDSGTDAINFSFRFEDASPSVMIPDQAQQFTLSKPHMPFATRKYIFVSVVVNNTAGTLVLYVDGVKLGSGSQPGVPFNPDAAIITLGSGYQGGFKGQIDNARINNRPLSGAEVLELATDGGSLSGKIDPSFSYSGSLFTGKSLKAVAVQPNGKVLVAGQNGGAADAPGLIRRLNADGSEDTAFSANIASLPVGLLDGGAVHRIVILKKAPNAGKILLAGTFTKLLVLLNSDGTVDSGFTSPAELGSGKLRQTYLLNNGVLANNFYDIKELGDGDILLAGTIYQDRNNNYPGNPDYNPWDDGTDAVALLRIRPDGSFNDTFNTTVLSGGKVRNTVGGLLPHSSNGTILVGTIHPGDVVHKLNDNGTWIDSTTQYFNWYPWSGLKFQPGSNGKVLVGGIFSSPQPSLIRMDFDTMDFDSSFSSTLPGSYPMPINQRLTTENWVVRPDGRILVSLGVLDNNSAGGAPQQLKFDGSADNFYSHTWNGVIRAMEVSGSRVYIVGDFTTPGDHIVRVF